jgi:excisionase family DNA binding protein
MKNENRPMYLLDGVSLEEKLRTIIQEELQILSQKINREPKILTRDQAAEKLGVCPNTISDYVKRGQLKNRGIGRKILIRESDLEGIKPNAYTFYKKAS